jgi:cytochrome P450
VNRRMSRAHNFDPFSPQTVECPFPFYSALRRDAPVYLVPGAGHFVVSRAEEIRAVVTHPEIFSSELVAVPTPNGVTRLDHIEGPSSDGGPANTLAIADPPAHTRHRKLLTRPFSTHEISRLEPKVRALAHELVDSFLSAGAADLMSRFAMPLPMTIIAEILGLPRVDLPRLQRWSDAGVKLLGGVTRLEELREAGRVTIEFREYLAAKLDEKARFPADDVASLVARAGVEGGEPLRREEMISLLLQLVIAGNESTASLIGSTVLILLRDEGLFASIKNDLTLIPALVEEALRLESPFQWYFRFATTDTELGGVAIPKGSVLMLLWGSANRDAAEFAAPDRADPRRSNLKAHFAFGEGIHYCLGAALARLEARLAIETLLERLPGLRLATNLEDLRHTPSLFVRRLETLPVEFDRS